MHELSICGLKCTTFLRVKMYHFENVHFRQLIGFVSRDLFRFALDCVPLNGLWNRQ